MPTPEPTEAELKRKINQQQAVISQQRANIAELKRTRVALVAGQYAQEVDPKAEAIKAHAFNSTFGDEFKTLILALRFYGSTATYTGTPPPIAADLGAKARASLKAIVPD